MRGKVETKSASVLGNTTKEITGNTPSSPESRGDISLLVVDLVLPFPNGSRIWALKLWVPCDSAEISLETLEHNVIKPGSL